MNILNCVKTNVTLALDTVTDKTHAIIDKAEKEIKLARLRDVMKHECAKVNRAYITLGKNYYNNKMFNKNDPCPRESELLGEIEHSKVIIKKTKMRYRDVLEK